MGANYEVGQAGNVTANSLSTNSIFERTPAAGVTIDTVPIKDGLVDGVDVSALKTDVDGFPDQLKTLTSNEITQVANIDASTISTTQWSYVGAMDQSVSTTSNITVNSLSTTGTISGGSYSTDIINEETVGAGVTIDSVLIKDGLVDGVDISALKTDVDGFPDELKTLTTGEIQQVANIGTSNISATEWSYVANLNQNLRTNSNVTFNTLDLTTVPNDNTESNLLVWNATTKDIEYRTVASLPVSGGDVSGPISSTNNAIALWNGTGGDILEDTSVTITSGTDLNVPGDITGQESLTVGNSTVIQENRIHVQSKGIATFWAEADTDNLTETDVAAIYMTQDGGTTLNSIRTAAANGIEIISGSTAPGVIDFRVSATPTGGGIGVLPTYSSNGTLALRIKTDGNTEVRTGLLLPTSGGTQGTLNAYEELDTTLTLGSAITGSVNVKLRRLNDLVTVTVDSKAQAIAVSSNVITISGMPTRFRAPNTVDFAQGIKAVSAGASEAGFVEINSGTNGRLDISRGNGNSFTTTAGFRTFTISYSVNAF